MRLLNVNTLQFEKFEGRTEIPAYTITSHRWSSDEPCFKTMRKNKASRSEGFQKVEGFCKFVRDENTRREAGRGEAGACNWIWLDTVCIDKESSADLIRWYRRAEVCYAYLADVRAFSNGRDAVMTDFARSTWFTRGWTLQELIAPRQVVFLTSAWEVIGTTRKTAPWHASPDLGDLIAEITGIPRIVFAERDVSTFNLEFLTVAERAGWMQSRETTKIEDMAYCLLGILGVYMNLLYGEGVDAWRHLEEEVSKKHNTTLALPRPAALDKRASGQEFPFWFRPISPATGLPGTRINNDISIAQEADQARQRMLAALLTIPSYHPNELGESLLEAATNGDESKVRTFLAKGAACNYRDRSGFTALHLAAMEGHEQVANTLISTGADINAQSLKLGTPLCLSVLRGHVSMVRLLLNKNAGVNNIGRWTGTALHCASWCGTVETAKLLLAYGANVTSIATIWSDFLDYGGISGSWSSVSPRKEPRTVSGTGHLIFDCQPLIVAAHRRQENLLQLLLDFGFPVDIEHRSWWTEHPDNQSFDDVSEEDRCDNVTALMSASWKGPHTLISKLLAAGTDVNKRDSWGRSPLWIAAHAGLLYCLQTLVKAGSQLDAVSDSGKSALHVSIEMGHAEVARYLVESGADVDRADVNGRTPCHFAAVKGMTQVLRILFNHNARYEARDRDGLTPFHSAVQQPKNLPAIECLLQHSANLHTPDDKGRTPLHSAAAENLPAVLLLLDAGADVSTRDRDERTALEYLPSKAPQSVRQRLTSSTLFQLPGSPGGGLDAGFGVESHWKGRSLSDSSVLAFDGERTQHINNERSPQGPADKLKQRFREETASKLSPVKSNRSGSA